ncbi:MAG: DUF86 domain-containing protein [Candidatus Aenigmarchaeota archaeon]|nr:DUF86 domain-containing protein [Candidatus Aenigmarchaeota archaeon]
MILLRIKFKRNKNYNANKVRLPFEFRKKYPEIEWKKIAGLRDVLIHEYSDVDLDLLWEIVTLKLSPLKHEIMKIRNGVQKA